MTPESMLTPGTRVELGSHLFTQEEIVAFARRYDPQPFHLDPVAARDTVLGGLCASGWHTAAMWMRKQRDTSARMAAEWRAAGSRRIEFGPSPGIRNLKWLRPVRPGDTIAYAMTIMECRASASRPGWHVLSVSNSGDNQDGEPVLVFESTALVSLVD